jgi:hypothetical protein
MQLLEAGHHVAATSLAGAILEDAMRKLAGSRCLPVPASSSTPTLDERCVHSQPQKALYELSRKYTRAGGAPSGEVKTRR